MAWKETPPISEKKGETRIGGRAAAIFLSFFQRDPCKSTNKKTQEHILILPNSNDSLLIGQQHGADPHFKLDRMSACIALEIPKFDASVIAAADDDFLAELQKFSDMRSVLSGKVPY